MGTRLSVEDLSKAIIDTRKYRTVSEETVQWVVSQELSHHKTRKGATKAARARLHRILAPYLGDPDYGAAGAKLCDVVHTRGPEDVKRACAEIMADHATTRERLPFLDSFYREVFSLTGEPHCVLDLACGLNPLALPWMQHGSINEYIAFDIHVERIAFINQFLGLLGLPQKARVQDIAFRVPTERADLALLLMEMHRLEANYPRRSLSVLDGLRARYVVVSFPRFSLRSGRPTSDRFRRFFHNLLSQRTWLFREIELGPELVFVVEKQSWQA
jgi:16S rRNA (guanine(1405)-N(7))-methyltransferase